MWCVLPTPSLLQWIHKHPHTDVTVVAMYPHTSHPVKPQTVLLHITHQIQQSPWTEILATSLPIPSLVPPPTDQERLYTKYRHMQSSYFLPIQLGIECRSIDTVGINKANTSLLYIQY